MVAAVTIDGYEAPWTRGTFAPGPAYPRYRDFFEAEAHARMALERMRMAGLDTAIFEKTWASHKRALNELELVLSGKAIHDARLVGDGVIEFVMDE